MTSTNEKKYSSKSYLTATKAINFYYLFVIFRYVLRSNKLKYSMETRTWTEITYLSYLSISIHFVQFHSRLHPPSQNFHSINTNHPCKHFLSTFYPRLYWSHLTEYGLGPALNRGYMCNLLHANIACNLLHAINCTCNHAFNKKHSSNLVSCSHASNVRAKTLQACTYILAF